MHGRGRSMNGTSDFSLIYFDKSPQVFYEEIPVMHHHSECFQCVLIPLLDFESVICDLGSLRYGVEICCDNSPFSFIVVLRIQFTF